MDFELTDDQLELQRIVREVAERECPPARLREVLDGKGDQDLWSTYVGLDWPSLTVAEEDGGMGFGAVELLLVLEELGRVADPSPFLATAGQFVPLVRACGDADQRRALLGPVCAGHTGAAAFGAGTVVATRAAGGGWSLSGTVHHVLDGDRAEELAVVATTDDGTPAAFVLPAGDAGVTATRQVAFDGTLHLATITLDGATVGAERALLAGGPAGIADARLEAIAGMAAVTVGASQRVFDIALGHVKDRKQFGVPIGSFQSLKHMAVDVFVAIERARALHQYAGLTLAERDPERELAASMAKVAAGDAQRIAVRHGIQFFGGLGYTWENDLHLYARRAKAGELLLGTSPEHKAVVAGLSLPTTTGEDLR